MSLVSFLVLAAFSLDVAAKCDNYVVGTVWIHTLTGDEEAQFQGCKKGCFWNNTYTEDGARKCEKCSDIEDEINCTNNEATCQWKNGKCKSQSCPNIAKTKNTGAYITDNTQGEVSKGRARQLKECLEGSALEQKYNTQYWNDYRDHHNYRYYVNNIPDYCVGPASCSLTASNSDTDNRRICLAQSGCTYVNKSCTAGDTGCDVATVHSGDTCEHISQRCYVTPATSGADLDANIALDRTACTAKGSECRFYESTTRPTCVAAHLTFLKTDNATTNKQSCESLNGVYVPDTNYPQNPYNDDCALKCFLTGTTGFEAGKNTKEECENRQCAYFGGDTRLTGVSDEYPGGDTAGVAGAYPGDGINLRKGGVIDLCEYGDKTGKNYSRCRSPENASLAINYERYRCDDRLFTESNSPQIQGGYCTIGGSRYDQYTTQSACLNSYRCSNPAYATESDCRSGGSCSNSAYTTQYACESSYSCSDPIYTTQSACESSGYCNNYAYTSQSECEDPGYCNSGSYQTRTECVNAGYCSVGNSNNPTDCTSDGGNWYSSGYYWNSYYSWYLNSWNRNTWSSSGGNWVRGQWQNEYPDAEPEDCRTLFSTTKQKCEFDINERKNYLVFESGLGGNLRPGTYYERCVQDEKLRTDPFIILENPDPVKNIITTNITSANRQILYGYDTAESYCTHRLEDLLEQCQRNYDSSVQSCYDKSEDLALDYDVLLDRNHVGTKAARTACHQIYGCMYSKSNERCSVWSVWALVLTLVITIVVVVAGLGVVGILVLPKLKGSSA